MSANAEPFQHGRLLVQRLFRGEDARDAPGDTREHDLVNPR